MFCIILKRNWTFYGSNLWSVYFYSKICGKNETKRNKIHQKLLHHDPLRINKIRHVSHVFFQSAM